jgi:hypothetical protein
MDWRPRIASSMVSPRRSAAIGALLLPSIDIVSFFQILSAVMSERG